MKSLIAVIALLMPLVALTAAPRHLDLYSGKPQKFKVSELKPDTTYTWKLSTTHGRILGTSQVKSDNHGSADMSLQCPPLEPGSTVKAVMKLSRADQTKTYDITFHSQKVFAPYTAILNQKGVYVSSDKMEEFLEQTGIIHKEPVNAKICLLENEGEDTIDNLIRSGKTVIYFTDGINQMGPSSLNLQSVNLILFNDPTIKKAMSFEITGGTLLIDYLDRISMVILKYSTGRLIFIAPQWRESMYKTPKLWLNIINIIKNEELKK